MTTYTLKMVAVGCSHTLVTGKWQSIIPQQTQISTKHPFTSLISCTELEDWIIKDNQLNWTPRHA